MSTGEEIENAHRAYRAHIEKIARLILRDDEEARDVASDAFVALVARGPDDTQATLAWLIATSKRKALNRVRDRARALRRASQFVDRPSVELSVSDPRIQALTRVAMSRLSERDQKVLELRFLDDGSIHQIANVIGVNDGAARVALHRAASHFRKEVVRQLAAHHKISAGCVHELMNRAESGGKIKHCGACLCVHDEISALANSIVPFALPNFFRRVGGLIHRTMASINRGEVASVRLVEALTALLITAGMTLHGGSISGASPHPELRKHLTSTPMTESRNQAIASLPWDAVRANHSSSERNVRVLSNGSHNTDLIGNNDPLQGTPLDLAFGVKRSIQAPYNIVRITASSVVRHNLVSGLKFHIGLAGAPDVHGTYRVMWLFGSNQNCSGTLITEGDASSPRQMPGFWVNCGSYKWEPRANWSALATSSLEGNAISLEVDFGSLDKGMRKLLKPGALLDQVNAMTWSAVPDFGVAGLEDSEPQNANARYEIAR